MRLAFITDLHLDFGPQNRQFFQFLADWLEESKPDVLAVGGDVATNLNTLRYALNRLASVSPSVLFVPGNHDIWHTTQPGRIPQGASLHRYTLEIPKLCREVGIHYLPNSPTIINGVGFAGTIGWYDYTFRHPQLEERFTTEDYRRKSLGRVMWYDALCADWGASDEEVCANLAGELENDLARLKEAGADKIVCVTHHVPFARCVEFKGRIAWDYFGAFMGTELIERVIRSEPAITLALFGHTHRRMDVTTEGVRAVCPAVGYLRTRIDFSEYASKTVFFTDAQALPRR